MKFRTEYTARPSAAELDPRQPAVLIGSCFTDYIGRRMRECRWRAFPNVTGTLYNPSSIAKVLRLASAWDSASGEIKASVAERHPLWVSWLADSQCTASSSEETARRVSDRLLSLHRHLEEAETLIVTFGTAWVYELCGTDGYVVANCHKFPASGFTRRRLSVEEIVSEWNRLLSQLFKRYPSLRVILTVSPVRHLKDGFEGNSRSKAVLLLACERLCSDNERCAYFPAYEIVNDDLRDYRFYDQDMVHPSRQAVDYIWQKFQETYLPEPARALLAEGEKVTKRLAHRPIIHGESEQALYAADLGKSKAMQCYRDFIDANPGMLRLDE